MMNTGMMNLVDAQIGPIHTKGGPSATVETPNAHGSPSLVLKKQILAQ